MFIDDVKAVKVPEDFSGPIFVRFDCFQRPYSVGPQVLLQLPKSGIKLLRAFTNREVNLVTVTCCGGTKRDQVIGQMVESASEILNSVPGDKGILDGIRPALTSL